MFFFHSYVSLPEGSKTPVVKLGTSQDAHPAFRGDKGDVSGSASVGSTWTAVEFQGFHKPWDFLEKNPFPNIKYK